MGVRLLGRPSRGDAPPPRVDDPDRRHLHVPLVGAARASSRRSTRRASGSSSSRPTARRRARSRSSSGFEPARPSFDDESLPGLGRAAATSRAASSAWYELRTSGPEATDSKPSSSAASRSAVELVRVPVADHRQVILGRAQVLADGEDLDPCSRRMRKVSTISSKSSPRPTISPDLVTTSSPPISFAMPQHPARAQEVRAAAGPRVEAGDRLDVVVEDVGPLVDHLRQRHLLAAEVGRQHLDLALRGQHPDRADHADERRGAVVGQVVAVDRGDHRVAQAHLLHLGRDPQRLERVVPGRARPSARCRSRSGGCRRRRGS